MLKRLCTAAVLLVLVLIAVPSEAYGAVTVSRAEIRSGTLRLEGRAIANRSITVDGVRLGTASGSGTFRIARSGYTPPADCTVDVNDGSASPAVARLTGCTVSSAPPPATANTISPNVAEFAANVGTPFQETFVFGPNVTSPSSFRIESGTLPAGLALTEIPNTSPRPVPRNAIRIQGTPTTEQTTTFTLRATDADGRTATRTYTIRVGPPRPLTITPQAWGLLAAGSPQNLFVDGDGGVKPYAWSISGGALPPGMSVIQDSAEVGLARIGGTPSAAGTYAFTLRLTDALGTTLDRAFTVSVSAPIVAVLQEVAVTPTVVGGATPIASVRMSPAPSVGGASVALSSSNPAVASVPASVNVAPGDTVGAFPVTTTAVAATATATITATFDGIARTTTLTVTPPASTSPPPPAPTTPPPATTTDTVSITRAEYDSGKRQLRVEAASSRTGATLRAHVTSSDALIGTLSGGAGQFSVGANPQQVTVKSSLGGTATRSVTVK